MSDRLLPLYDQELGYLRSLAGEFADAHPKIAGRLRLSADAVDDPHVARLIEGFALVAARIRQKLDDEFPELTDSLLGALYPHLLAPFPSASRWRRRVPSRPRR
jgi:type VI secretion system protein ImpG